MCVREIQRGASQALSISEHPPTQQLLFSISLSVSLSDSIIRAPSPCVHSPTPRRGSLAIFLASAHHGALRVRASLIGGER